MKPSHDDPSLHAKRQARILARNHRFDYRHPHMPRSECALWGRLSWTGMTAAALTVLLRSNGSGIFFRQPLMEPTTPVTWSLVLPLMIFVLIGIAIRTDVRAHPMLARPTLAQFLVALLSTGLLFVLASWILHPTPLQFASLQRWGADHPTVGDPLLGALLGFLILLPVLPLLAAALPWSLLRSHRAAILLSIAGAIGFLLFPALEAAYFHMTGPPLIASVQRILHLLPGSVPDGLGPLQVGYSHFSVTVGYACTEFSSLALFLGLLGVAFRSLHRTRSISWPRAGFVVVTGIMLLWLLNVLRIAAIVVIGSYHRAFALTLFHSGIGLILFLLFFLLYTKLSLPFVRKGKYKT